MTNARSAEGRTIESRTLRTVGLAAVLLTSGLAAACVGKLGDSPSPSGGGPAMDPLACATGVHPGEAPIRRMTRFEYNNTVRDLLGDTSAPANSFAADEESLGFNNQASTLVVTQLLAEQYMNASEALAKTAVTDVVKLTGCDAVKVGNDACGAQFIESFGKRAFRRPLDDDGRAMLKSVFTAGAAMPGGFNTGIRLVIEAALQSPQFLYRVEFGMPNPTSDGAIKLDDYEVASRLSYLLWGSMPDDTLFAAAAAGELQAPEQVAAQAKRMLADPKAHDAVRNFHEQWLKVSKIDTIDKDDAVYPSYKPAMRAMWKAETLAFVDDVIFGSKGDLSTLLTASYTMMNAEVAAFYGVSNGPTGSGFVHVDLDPKQRSGLLTQPSVLAVTSHPNQSSPVHRGKFVREQLLCQQLPPPPANLKIVPPAVDPNATTRQKFAEHDTDPACSGCHHLMDPIGVGFEHYDALGQWRDTDHGFPVDATGEVKDSKDVDGKFDGVVDLSQRLAGSEQVRACVVSQWFRYGHGRPETTDDACTMKKLGTAFQQGKYSIQELLVAITQTDAFLYRKPVVASP
jgi:Protein of unknown function (DUF1592)/Protein of unknown function (DUF1588)/Protein of unknown function (DUF1587)/Protein of unknown function (DUF1585)/Protein of unknown function (DUF1595)